MNNEKVAVLDIRSLNVTFLIGCKGVNGTFIECGNKSEKYGGYTTEGFLDEIYYFEFDKPQGFGFQAVYSKEGDINEVYKVKTGDLVEVPKGYHPFTVAPGYKNYCLWIMAGKNRGIFCTSEEEHKWVNN